MLTDRLTHGRTDECRTKSDHNSSGELKKEGYEEHFCEIILKSGHWPRRCCLMVLFLFLALAAIFFSQALAAILFSLAELF